MIVFPCDCGAGNVAACRNDRKRNVTKRRFRTAKSRQRSTNGSSSLLGELSASLPGAAFASIGYRFPTFGPPA
jgi:hypothetical protein